MPNASKEDWLPIYRQSINDTWTEWLSAVYQFGAQEWSYRIPEDSAERKQLRDLGGQTLAFENHYLLLYLTYLLKELSVGDCVRHNFAYQRLQEIDYPLLIVVSTLRELWTKEKDRAAVAAMLPSK